jgi:hypothetical protein
MALKTYIDQATKDFLKTGSGELLFGIQNAPTYKLLPIFKAYESGSTASPTEITAVKIGSNSSVTMELKEIDRTSLATDLIYFDSTTNQYLVDQTKTLASLLDECIYYLEFKNGYNIFETEAFLVQIQEYPIKWDMTILTFDSTLVTFDQTNYEI